MLPNFSLLRSLRGIIMLLLLAVNVCHAGRHTLSVAEYLQKQAVIRVCLSTGPGYGDQANSANVMKHLRELGFRGKFDVIYDPVVQGTITTVFDLPRTIPDVYEDRAQQTTFMTLAAYEQLLAQHRIPWTDFGFGMGKVGVTCDIETAYSRAFAEFSPYFSAGDVEQDETTIDVIGKKTYFQENSGNKYLVSPYASYADAKDFLQNTAVGKQTVQQKPALLSFFDGLDQQQFTVMFAYGYSLKMQGNGRQGDVPVMASNILQTLLGARYAQTHGQQALHKPLIIAVLYDYQNDMTELLHLIQSDDWGNLELPGATEAKAAIRDMKLAKVLQTADITDIQTIQKIQRLQPDQILLLSLGSLPKTVFDGLFNHVAANVLPSVREGAGTFNTIVTTGRPSFECAATDWQDLETPGYLTWTAGLRKVNDDVLKQTLTAFYNSRTGYCAILQNQHDFSYDFHLPWQAKAWQRLGELIIAAEDEQSAFSRYFRDLREDALNPENDRVKYALEAVMAM